MISLGHTFKAAREKRKISASAAAAAKKAFIVTRFGDFGGLAATESLDYLQYLGVTMLYLQPIFPSAAYHGYQHGVPDTLNPRFGTEPEFLAFVNAAHARGIKVILDFVAYGVSHNSTYYQSAFQNPASPFDPWLAFTNTANSTFTKATALTVASFDSNMCAGSRNCDRNSAALVMASVMSSAFLVSELSVSSNSAGDFSRQTMNLSNAFIAAVISSLNVSTVTGGR